jgi:hypothetical protein
VSIAPDYAEPLEAWRVWRVVRSNGEFSLGSVVQRILWRPGETFSAACLRPRRLLRRFRRTTEHDAPEPACECGIYGATLECAGYYLAEAPFFGGARVVGTVALWGTVVECERGYRASYAYPTRIFVPADAGDPWRIGWDEVAFGLCRYGVPIELLAARAAEAADVLAARVAA